ncbi:S1C family serine protease [Oceaniglobus indicus]|uniref:S1C family serine protease n=1 Tax=Oceaniglobus indicus TaxID=2047749 RepID=UPI000C189C5A|nr:trypsin-like peptidase domain-containing protein [Oceaniglobus indicus]
MSIPSTMTPVRHIAALVLAVFLAMSAWPATARAADAIGAAVNATLILLDDDGNALGSGILLDDGVVLTDAASVGNRGAVVLRTVDGTTTRGRVIARDARRGLAVIRAETDLGAGLKFAPVAARPGQEVYAVGAPYGMGVMVTRGIVSAAATTPDPTVPIHGLRHDAVINAGVAGGPLLDSDGRLLGMVRAAQDGDLAAVGWAVTAADLQRLVPLMVAGALRDVPELGLGLRAVTPVIAAALGIDARGLLVDAVTPGSRAARAGVVAGDVIVSFEGAALADPADLAWRIDARIADAARLSVRRDGAAVVLTLDLAAVVPTLLRISDGAAIAPVASYTFGRLGVRFEDEARVANVSLHSPAYLGGLQDGDIVLALNGRPVSRSMLETFDIDAPVLLLVSRGGKTRHVLIDPWRAIASGVAQTGTKPLDAGVNLF